MPKATRATKQQRIHEVMQLILAGAEFADIWQYVSERAWQVSERQTRRYLEAAYDRITQVLEREASHLLGRHLMQRRALYARCLKANDIRTALIVLHDEAQLLGLYPAKKIAPTTPDGQEPYDPTGSLAELLPELQAALDRLGCDPGSEGPQPSESDRVLGPAAEGLGLDHGAGGAAARPLACSAPIRPGACSSVPARRAKARRRRP